MADGLSPSRSRKYCSSAVTTHFPKSCWLMLPTPPLVFCFHRLAEGSRADQAFGIPGDVLSRDLDPRVQAVEIVKIFEMRHQDGVNLADRCRRHFFAGLQIMFNFAEQPGATLGGAADRETVGAGHVEDGLGLFGCRDVAV